jgi:long-subunit fatty acid transport protein
VGVLVADRAANAQSTAQIPLQFDFMNPGARSLGMGSAFIGAADDATAAFANPAGLALLNTREISAELRSRRVETPFLQGGRISGTVTGTGADTIAGPSYGIDVDQHVTPTFLSFIMPTGSFTFALYVHEAVGIENTFFSNGVFERLTFAGITDDNNRDLPLGGTRTMTIRSYGGALGFKHGRFAFGGGASADTFDLESSFARYSFVSNVFSPADRGITIATATQQGNDVSVGANVGFLYSIPNGFSVGMQFRRGPRFAFSQEDRVPISQLDLIRPGHFKVPDVFGIGAQWKVNQSLRFVVDYDRVQYSQLKTDFIDIQALSSGRQDQLRTDDGNEVHGGAEYLFLNLPHVIALRGGAWFDPDHAVRYEATPANDATDVLLKATLPGGENLVHYTFGAGIALANRVEINGGADLSSRTTYITASAVVRF